MDTTPQKSPGMDKRKYIIWVGIVLLLDLLFTNSLSTFVWEAPLVIIASFFLYRYFGQPGYQEKNKWGNVHKKRFWTLFAIAVILLAFGIYLTWSLYS